MDANGSQDGNHRTVSRRRFVQAAGASGVAVGLSGCLYGGGGGGGGGGGDSASGTVQWMFDATQANSKAAKEIEKLFHDAGLSQDIKLEFVPKPSDSTQAQQKYNQLLNANQSKPDMLMMDSGWTVPFIARQQLQNLSQELPQNVVKKVKNKYFQASVETAMASQGGGDLYGVPIFPDFPAMHYRKDLAKKAGYDTSNWATTPMTWKRFSQVAADVTKQNNLDMGFTFQFDVYEGLSCCDFNEFMTSWGGAYFGGRKNLFGPVGKRPVTVNEKPVIDSIRMVRTLIHGQSDPEALPGYQQIAPTDVLSWTEDTSLAPFIRGRAFAVRNWPYAINSTFADAKWASPESYGTMPLPYRVKDQADGVGGSTAALGGWHASINPNTQKMDAAIEVIKTMTTKQVQLGLFKITGWLPPQPSLYASKEATSVKPSGDYLDTLRFAGETSMPRPVTVAWPDESGQIAQEVNAAASQQKPTQAAMQSLQSSIERIEKGIGSS